MPPDAPILPAMENSIAPGLLIAMPALDDPNFFRSMVLLCAHSQEGAFGMVLNHPLALTASELCADTDIAWDGGQGVPVHSGGPVEFQRGWLLHDGTQILPESQEFAPDLFLTGSLAALTGFAAAPSGDFRLILGYSRWGPGKLEEELADGSWLTAPLNSELAFLNDPAAMWTRALGSLGIEPAHLVDAGTQLN